MTAWVLDASARIPSPKNYKMSATGNAIWRMGSYSKGARTRVVSVDGTR